MQTLDAAEITQLPILQLRKSTQHGAQQCCRLGRDQRGEAASPHNQRFRARSLECLAHGLVPRGAHRAQTALRQAQPLRGQRLVFGRGKDRAQHDIGVVRLRDGWMAADELRLRKGDRDRHRDEQ